MKCKFHKVRDILKEKPDKGLEIIQTLRYRGHVAWPVKINLDEYIKITIML